MEAFLTMLANEHKVAASMREQAAEKRGLFSN
jgi:hypothetical protein